MSPIARCSCGGSTCACLIKAGDGIRIEGSGQPTDPYVVTSLVASFAGSLLGQSSDTLTLEVVGSGTAQDPFVITGSTSVSMTSLSDVQDASGPALGDVPFFNGSHFEFGPPPTVPPGTVSATGGITGDGTLATPLRVAVSDTTTTSTSGLAIYVDSAGKLRADASSIAANLIRSNATGTRRQARVLDSGPVFEVQTLVNDTATTVFSVDESGTVTTGSVRWENVTRRPTSFTPSEHTQDASTITGADSAGSRQRAWNDWWSQRILNITGNGDWSVKANKGPLPGRAVMDINGTNAMGLRWDGQRVVMRVDDSEWAVANVGDVDYTIGLIGGRALAFGDAYTTRYSRGPDGGAYGRGMQGSGFFAVWMDNTLQFGRNTSSRRFKEDIEPFAISMDQVLALGEKVVSYHRVGVDDRYEVGMIAEEVNPILPWAVTWYAEPDVDPETGEPIPGLSSQEPVIDGLRYDLLSLPALVGVRTLHERQEKSEASWKRKHDLLLARVRRIEAALNIDTEEA